MLEPLTTEEFAQWFEGLDDPTAEDVATAIEVIERLGPAEAAPGSRESLLWYEHPSVSKFVLEGSLAWDLEAWGGFHGYAKQILEALSAPRFLARLSVLGVAQAAEVLRLTHEIRKASDPRLRWALKLAGESLGAGSRVRPENASAGLRGLYLATLAAAGFDVEDVPAHSLALRELARRSEARSFRLLYGVHSERGCALFVLGERLDRTYYGDSVLRAEKAWKRFLDGTLPAVEPAQLR